MSGIGFSSPSSDFSGNFWSCLGPVLGFSFGCPPFSKAGSYVLVRVCSITSDLMWRLLASV